MILLTLDFDGVLVDTKNVSREIFIICLKKFSNYKSLNLIYPKLYKICDGLNLDQISSVLSKKLGTKKKLIHKFFIKEWSINYKKVSLTHDTLNFLKFVESLNAKIVIMSSSSKKTIETILKKKYK